MLLLKNPTINLFLTFLVAISKTIKHLLPINTFLCQWLGVHAHVCWHLSSCRSIPSTLVVGGYAFCWFWKKIYIYIRVIRQFFYAAGQKRIPNVIWIMVMRLNFLWQNKMDNHAKCLVSLSFLSRHVHCTLALDMNGCHIVAFVSFRARNPDS